MAITIWSGLVLGSIYALVATGFTISMLPTGVFNFAQGAIVVAGAFLSYQFLSVSNLGGGLPWCLPRSSGWSSARHASSWPSGH